MSEGRLFSHDTNYMETGEVKAKQLETEEINIFIHLWKI
jgi:hypothetical protein